MRWNETAFNSVIESYLSSYEDTRTPPLYINVPNVVGRVGGYTYMPVVPLKSLREVEKEIILYEDDDSYNNIAVFDLRRNIKL